MRKENKKKRDIKQEATDLIVKQIEEGTVPWRKPWNDGLAGFSLPRNGGSNRPYRNLNTIILMGHPGYIETGDPRFYTFNQVQTNNWKVIKGSKSVHAYFFKKIEVDNEEPKEGEEDKKKIPMLKTYPLFHASQIEGCPEYKPDTVPQPEWQKPLRVKAMLDASGANIGIGGNRAFYDPVRDRIQLPPESAFQNELGWSSTALHESAHWTGHKDRLDRQFGKFGDTQYAREELRAELASVFLSMELGIEPDFSQHASYVENWAEILKEDKNEIFKAASDAQKISDYMMQYAPELSTEAELAAAAGMPEHLMEELGIDNSVVTPPFDVSAPVYGGPGL